MGLLPLVGVFCFVCYPGGAHLAIIALYSEIPHGGIWGPCETLGNEVGHLKGNTLSPQNYSSGPGIIAFKGFTGKLAYTLICAL